MTPIAALLLLQAAPQNEAARDVVVTARPLAETERAWRDCMARDCPPDQEVAAATAHAENQFVAGDYKEARSTLLRSIDRVRGNERRYPVALGDIWRAKSRIDAHLGETDRGRIAASQSLLALKAGLPDDDPRVLTQRIELGDTLVQSGRYRQGLAIYEGVARSARKLDRKVYEGHALLRIAALWTAAAGDRLRSTAAAGEARRAISKLTRTTEPELAAFREATGLLTAKLDARRGDDSSIDRLVASYRNRATEKPMLIYAPPIDPFSQAASPVLVNGPTGAVGTSRFEDQWIDISFWIAPDGSVRDVDVLRESEGLNASWVGPVLHAVRGRRYAPLKSVEADTPGLMRVERVTYTSGYFVPTGSRIRMRDGRPLIIVTDLSVDAPAG